MSHSVFRRRPVVGLWLVFFVNGAVLSAWAPRIPEIATGLALSDAALGGALFGVAGGSVPALVAAGSLLRRVDCRPVCLTAGAAFAGGLPLLATADGPLALGAALALLGAASGVLDVAMNTAGVEFGSRRGASVLSRLHGGYSLGVLAGAAGGDIATRTGIGVGPHFLAWSALLLVLLAIAAAHLPRRAPSDGEPDDPRPARGMPGGVTVGIAALAVAALLLEGTLTDWTALLLARDHEAGRATGASAVVAFSLAMFVSRTAGDRVLGAVGRDRFLLLAAAVVAAGTAVAPLTPGWAGAYAGIVAAGLVLGPVFPAAVAAAAERSPGSVAAATAAVSAVGYLAYLGGPPLVGFLADRWSLPVTVAAVGASCAAVFAAGAHGRRRHCADA
ncbi:hypothetical protein [Tsukamurella sp. 1534]|uniref:hypothetical protein n=1 Tax=Tsukamurella sp. 1534 TaxID=1151061 RepID=UPI00030DA6A7|nr:hypothetical protein [Tsukamurella sp. 1534]